MVLGAETMVLEFEYCERRLAMVVMFKLSGLYKPIFSADLLKNGLNLIEE